METQKYIAQTSGASLVILENDQIRVCALDTRPEWTVGRYDPDEPNVPDILFTQNYRYPHSAHNAPAPHSRSLPGSRPWHTSFQAPPD